jgi:hypothetical protein
MSHCPKCNSVFSDNERFCENDGTPLIADDPYDYDDLTEQEAVASRPSAQTWKAIALVVVVAVAGAAIGLVLFVVYQEKTRINPTQSSNEPVPNVFVPQQQTPPPSPVASSSPTPEPSPSPSATPSVAKPVESPRVELSSNPVSSSAGRSGPVTIRLTNGSTVEADEAWETGEGIWYRRRGVVTLLQRTDVKSIEKPTPVPSPPTASPKPSP